MSPSPWRTWTTPEITGPATVEREEGDGTDAATFVASDPDDKGIEWRLGGTDSEGLDQATHAVVVTATDPSNFTDTVDVTITVEDVDETPEITGPATVEREEGDGTDAATFVASDPDDKGIEWRLGGLRPIGRRADLQGCP